MKISTFTKTPSSGRFLCNPTWYIDACGKKLLFVSSGSGPLSAETYLRRNTILNDIDIIILPAGCIEPVREIQYFLFASPHAEFYLPKASSQKYFLDIFHKLNGYCKTEYQYGLLSRIHFVNDLCSINQNLMLFGSDPYPADSIEHRQSLLIQEDSCAVLFANTGAGTPALEAAFSRARDLTCLKIKRVIMAAGEYDTPDKENHSEKGA